MYIQLVSVHGLIRGNNIEMGRDADTGGQVRYVLELARALARQPEVKQVDLFTRQIKDKRYAEDYAAEIEPLAENARIVRLPCGGGRYLRKERLWSWLDDYVDAMIWFTRKEGRTPSLVHGHYADAGYVAKEVAAAFAVPFVFTGHSLGRDKKAYLESQGWTPEAMEQEFSMSRRIAAEEACLAEAELVIASTRHEVETQYGRYDHGRGPRFEIIPPGTSLERFFPYYDYELSSSGIDETFKQAQMRMRGELARFHFQQDRPLILALCRPDKRKNIGALIEAYGEDKELQAMANLAVFAGIRKSIADMPESEQAVLTDILLLMDRYDLYGKLAIPKKHDSEFDVPELYRLAAATGGVFVNPAFVEPFGLTFIESSAVGLPFVGTENGGPQDIARNCESGLLVNVEDSANLSRAIKQLLTDRDLWHRCSTNGINRVREHYTWETHSRRYLEHLTPLTKVSETASLSAPLERSAPGRRLADVEYLLITDIDNTLLGDDAALEQLAALLREHSGSIGFGVASGRHIGMVKEALARHDLPRLDVCISSVGTEIYYGPEFVPDKGWASRLRYRWRRDSLEEALRGLPFLKRQEDVETQREFKISYDLDTTAALPETALPQLREALSKARAPHTLVFSHGAYVDVLPHRASKGKAVRYLATKWGIPLRNIATAGDSGNDADMLRGETAGIVVGNHSPELEPLRKGATRVYFARAHFAGGIIEGLRHYGMLPEAER